MEPQNVDFVDECNFVLHSRTLHLLAPFSPGFLLTEYAQFYTILLITEHGGQMNVRFTVSHAYSPGSQENRSISF
jgi:hypothetical protein